MVTAVCAQDHRRHETVVISLINTKVVIQMLTDFNYTDLKHSRQGNVIVLVRRLRGLGAASASQMTIH